MIFYYKIFARNENVRKKVKKREEEKRSDLLLNNEPMLTNWVQIERSKTLKTMRINQN